MAANALAFYRLSGELLERPVARAVSSFVFAVSPILVSELGGGRPTQAFVPFLCLGLRQALRVDQDPRAWMWCGLHLALTGLTYWFAAIWGALLLGAAAAARSPKRAAWALGLALLLVAPWLAAYASRVLGGGPLPGVEVSKDPHPMTVLWWTGELAVLDPHKGVKLSPLAMLPSAGPELLLGMAAAAALAWRERLWRALLIIWIITLVFALGPRPFDLLPSPLYAAWMTLGPIARRLWFPCRALVVPAMIGALALGVLLDRALGGPRRRWALPATGALLLAWLGSLFALQVLPLPTWSPPSPGPVRWLAQQPAGSVIALPDSKESVWLVHQIQHGKPVQLQVGGQNPVLAVPEAAAWQRNHPLLALLEGVVDGKVPPREVEPGEREALVADGFRWVLVDFGAFDVRRSPKMLETSRRRLTRLLGEPVAFGDQVVIWSLEADGASAPRIDPARGSAPRRAGP